MKYEAGTKPPAHPSIPSTDAESRFGSATQRRSEMETDIATLEASFHGTSQVKVYCPHCRRYHFHGNAGVVAGRPEHRVAHCTKPGSPYERRGYYFVVAAEDDARGGTDTS